MASKWQELEIDWENIPAGLHLYTGFKYVMEAINERHRIVRNDPLYNHFDLDELNGRYCSGAYGSNQIAIKIRDGIWQLASYFIPENASAYNTADPNDDNYLNFDALGLPLTYSSGTIFEDEFGDTITNIFNPYITDDEAQHIPKKGMLEEAYKILKKFNVYRAEATSSIEYAKTVYVAEGAGIDAAAVNTTYGATATVETEKDGDCIVPGVMYVHCTLGTGGDSNWFTAFQDSYPSSLISGGLGPSGIRCLPAANTSGRFYFEIKDEDGNPIQPPVAFKPWLCFGGSDGSYTPHTGRAMGGLTPNSATAAQSDFGAMSPWPRALYTFTEVTPSYDTDKFTYDIFCDPAQADGLPASSQWSDGNNSKRFSLIRLDRFMPNQPGHSINDYALWRAIYTVTPGDPSVKSMKAVMSVNLNDEGYLKYHTNF